MRREYEFAEVQVDPDVLERFSLEMSAYYLDEDAGRKRELLASYRRRLLWHIKHSLSPRQRQILLAVLSGKTERAIAAELGISQQVVHIYKTRAINKLHRIFVR